MWWMYLAISSVFMFTGMNLLQKVLAMESSNARAMAVAFNVTAASIAVLLYFLSGAYVHFQLPDQPLTWGYILVACLGYGLYERIRFRITKLVDASVYATLGNVSVIVAFIGSLFLYSESITLAKIVGMGAIIFGIILVSAKKETKSSAGGITLAILGQIILGIAWSLDKKGTLTLTPDTYSMFVWIIPLLVVIAPSIRTHEVVHEFKRSSWRIVVLAFLNVAGYILQLKAIALAQATQVLPIVQTSILFTVVAGIILLKERDNIAKKIIAGVLACIGVILLVTSQ